MLFRCMGKHRGKIEEPGPGIGSFVLLANRSFSGVTINTQAATFGKQKDAIALCPPPPTTQAGSGGKAPKYRARAVQSLAKSN